MDQGGGWGCEIRMNDIQVPFGVLSNHFKCTSISNVPAGTDWLARDFDDSQWSPASTVPVINRIWAQGSYEWGNIYCRLHATITHSQIRLVHANAHVQQIHIHQLVLIHQTVVLIVQVYSCINYCITTNYHYQRL